VLKAVGLLSLVIGGVGIATGRAGRAGGADPIADRAFSEGAGI